MELSILRSIADWLADGTNGANAEISNLDLDAGDSAPANVAAVKDETRHGEVARREYSQAGAAELWVIQSAPLVYEIGQTQGSHDARMDVAVVHPLRDATTQNGARDAMYRLQAAMRSLRALLTPANVASRTRNQVVILEAENWRIDQTFAIPETDQLARALTLTVRAREQNP